jgi:hypothetical protein
MDPYTIGLPLTEASFYGSVIFLGIVGVIWWALRYIK